MLACVRIASGSWPESQLRPLLPGVPPVDSSRVNEELLEAVAPGPEHPFDAIECPAPLPRKLQLAVHVVERLCRQLSPRLLVPGGLETLPIVVSRTAGANAVLSGIFLE